MNRSHFGKLFFFVFLFSFSALLFGAPPQSTVVVVRNPNVWKSGGTLDPVQVREMLEVGLKALSGDSSAKGALEKIFRPKEKIAIKINTITRNPVSATKPALTWALIDCLKESGIPAGNITVFDRKPGKDKHEIEPSGYKLNQKPGEVQVREGGPLGPERKSGNLTTRFYSPIETADAVINLPVLKDHHIMGITFALKNHLGSIYNPRDCHANAGIPAIAELNSLPQIKEKQRLIIGDALCGQYNKGPHDAPEFHWKENALILGFDPVAVDWVAFQILEKVRKVKGLSWPKEMKYGGTAGKYLEHCKEKGLGTFPPKVIEIK